MSKRGGGADIRATPASAAARNEDYSSPHVIQLPISGDAVQSTSPSPTVRARSRVSGDANPQQQLLSYVPRLLLAEACEQLGALRGGIREACKEFYGVAILVDVSGFSKLGIELSKQSGGQAAENLTSLLNQYFRLLVACLHKQDASVLFFGGDSIMAFVPAENGRSMPEAAARALRAAVDVRSVRFAAHDIALTAHTGIGTGRLDMHLLQAGPQAANVLFAGSALVEACEAQRASHGTDVVLSASAARLLQLGPLAAPVDGPTPLFLLSPTADRSALRIPAENFHVFGPGLCGCGAPVRDTEPAAATILATFSRELRAIAAGGSPGGGGFFEGDMRGIFALFCAFPEMDGLDGSEGSAARAGEIVRCVHGITSAHEGYVNKIIVDDKGAVALVAFGAPAHEDDAARAVRAALALRDWFQSSGAPFAAGIASGRAFIGPLGAPCRKEWALISEAVTLASRLLSAAREALGSGPAAGQEVFCTEAVAEAAEARGGRGLRFDELPPIRVKGYPLPVAVRRPRVLVDGRASGSPQPAASDREGDSPSPPPEPPPDAEAEAALAASRPESVGALHGAASMRSLRGGGRVFVGRDEEVAAGRQAIEEVRSGRGRTLAIEGDAGYGKTRLLRELQRLCEARGFAVLHAAASADEAGRPLAALRGVLASLCPAPLESELVRRGLASAKDAALLAACLHAAAGDSSPRFKPSAEAAAEFALVGLGRVARVADALARVVRAVEDGGGDEGPRPVALFVEDLHWADSASWLALRCLRDACPALLLVLSTRPMPTPPREYLLLSGQVSDPAGDILAAGEPEDSKGGGGGGDSWRSHSGKLQLPRLRPQPAASLLRLGPLSHDAASALVAGLAARAGARWPEHVTRALVERAEGVPLSLVELVRSQSSCAVQPRLSTGVPETIARIILSRADALPPAARAAAKLAAVLGSSFSPEAVRACDPDDPDILVVLGAFETLRRERIIARDRPGEAPGGALDSALASPPGARGSWTPQADFSRSRAGSAAGLLGHLQPGAGLASMSIDLGSGAGPHGASTPSLTFHGQPTQPTTPMSRASFELDSGPLSLEVEGGPGARVPHSFVFALQRDALYESIPLAQRRDLHARVAAWLERGGYPDAALLALHWVAAGDVARALPALERAARAARAGGALSESRRASARIVAAIDEHGLAGDRVPPAPAGFHGPDPPEPLRGRSAPEPADCWRVARALALANCAHVDFVSGRRRAAREAAMAAMATLGSPLRPRSFGLVGKAGVALSLLRSAAALRSATWGASTGAAAETDAGRAHRAKVESLYIVWHSAMTGESRPGEVPGPVLAVSAAVRAVQESLAAPQEVLTYHDVRVLAIVPLLLTMLRIGGDKRADAAHGGVHALAAIIRHDAALAEDAAVQATRRVALGDFEEAVPLFATAVPLLARVGEPAAATTSLDLALARLFTGRLEEAARAAEEALALGARVAGGATEYVAALAAVVGATVSLWRGNADAAFAVLSTMKQVEEASPGAEGRSWAQQVSGFGRALLAWRGGDDGAMWDLARSTVALWRVEGQSWHHILLFHTVVDYLQFRAFHSPAAARRPPRGGFAGALRTVRRWFRIRTRVQVEPQNSIASFASEESISDDAAGLAREARALMERTRRRRLPGLAPFCRLAEGGDPARPPPRRLAALRAARAGFARAGLRPYEALACLRLALAEPGAAAAAEARAAGERLAREAGLRIEPRGGVFPSLWPWGFSPGPPPAAATGP